MSTLIVRISPISNVAMVVPLLESMVRLHPDEEFVVVSRAFLEPLFSPLCNVRFVGVDLRGEHKGLRGIVRLVSELKHMKITKVIDLQRNGYSSLFILMLRIAHPLSRHYAIRREHMREWWLLWRGYKRAKALTTVFDLYRRCFQTAGYKTDNKFSVLPALNDDSVAQKLASVYGRKQGYWIGVAPFAQHRGKVLPPRKMREVIAHFDRRGDTTVFLFGAGEVEYEMLSDWETRFTHVHAVYTALNLREELELMRHLDVMLSMESANMHLASLVGLPVVSVWGASHKSGGSLGWNQTEQNIVEKGLSCRPCSLLGSGRNKRCPLQYACLDLDVRTITDKIEQLLK